MLQVERSGFVLEVAAILFAASLAMYACGNRAFPADGITRKAVTELLQVWIAEKRANGEQVPQEPDVFFTQIEIPDALQVG